MLCAVLSVCGVASLYDDRHINVVVIVMRKQLHLRNWLSFYDNFCCFFLSLLYTTTPRIFPPNCEYGSNTDAGTFVSVS